MKTKYKQKPIKKLKTTIVSQYICLVVKLKLKLLKIFFVNWNKAEI